MVLHGIAWYYTGLHGIAWYCMDIVVVAQKVKVVDEDQCDLKKWVGGGGVSLIGRDGY